MTLFMHCAIYRGLFSQTVKTQAISATGADSSIARILRHVEKHQRLVLKLLEIEFLNSDMYIAPG